MTKVEVQFIGGNNGLFIKRCWVNSISTGKKLLEQDHSFSKHKCKFQIDFGSKCDV